MPPNLPTLPPGALYNEGQFQIWWQQLTDAIEAQFTVLEDQVAAIAAANAAAAAANAAAATANTAAAAAQTTADNITAASALGDSYVTTGTPPVLSATDAGTDATITIGAHTRNYPQPDGSVVSVSVNAGSLTGLAYDTLYYIYYDDPARAGGAVTYHSTTDSATAAQIGDRHTVGSVATPLAGQPDNGGFDVDPPGVGSIKSNL